MGETIVTNLEIINTSTSEIEFDMTYTAHEYRAAQGGGGGGGEGGKIGQYRLMV